MYSKKYRLEKIEELNGHNYTYAGVEGSICYPAYLKVGERGWFLWESMSNDWYGVHRIHTSIVQNIEYDFDRADGDDGFVVETENTRLTFKLIRN